MQLGLPQSMLHPILRDTLLRFHYELQIIYGTIEVDKE